jgi:hypothetical protein
VSAPDFYLASSESYSMGVPRCCWRVRRLASQWRDDLLVTRINPSLWINPSQWRTDNDLPSRYLDVVLIAPRFKGSSLFPISEWPMYIHVALPLFDDLEHCDKIQSKVVSLAWAELYRTEEDARVKAI